MNQLQVISLPHFPEISHIKANRVITKHFTNTALYLPHNKISLLTWLIYQSKKDNTVVYSTQLLTKYCQAVKSAEEVYESSAGLSFDIKVIRSLFKQLVESGYLLPNYNKKLFTVNPMLSYYADISQKVYKQIIIEHCELSRHCSWVQPNLRTPGLIEDFTAKYTFLVK